MTENQSAPVDFLARVWIRAVALRGTPSIYAPIEAEVYRGETLHITAEQDGLCRTEDGLWVLEAALKKTHEGGVQHGKTDC